MKVALVVPGGVDRGGVERVIPCLLALIERLARVHALQVFALHQEPVPCSYPLLGATVHCVGAGRGASLRAVRAMLRESRRSPFELVHCFFGGTAPAGAAAAALLRVPLLVHLAGGELVSLPEIRYGGWRTPLSRMRMRAGLRRAARVTAPSRAMVARAARLGIAAERVTCGVDLRVWSPVAPRPREAGAPARLLWVGSLNRVKEPETVLRTAVALREMGERFTLTLAGEDILGGEMQRRAAELGVQAVFTGHLPPHRLRDLMLESDLLLVTSRHEAGPLVALEAAACGVPTVGTRVGHLADLAPEAALVAEPGDWKALAFMVRDCLLDEALRMGLASRAQAWSVENDAERGAQRTLAIYQEMT